MYRILLADDEGIVLESLKLIIEKNFPGQFEIRTAKTGRDVIELAEEFRPDIAFMDIQMPGINGIDAMREIKKTNKTTIFVVISAYDRFDYAKESVSMGVYEYVNKPFNAEQIRDLLNRIIASIEKKRKRRSDDLKIREKMETVTPIIENGFIYSIMFQEFTEEDVENYKQLLELECDHGCMLVFIVGDEQKGRQMTNAVGASVRLQENYLKIRDMIRMTYPSAIVGSVISNKIPVFLPQDKMKMEYEERIEMIDRCRELSRNLRKLFELRFRIGIGSITRLHDSLNSYEEALRALATSSGSVAHVDDLPLQCKYDEEYPIDLERQLFASMRDGNASQCEIAAEKYFDWMLANYDENNMSVRLKTLEFVLFAEHDAYSAGGMTYHFSDREDYLSRIMNAGSNHELKNWFVEHFRNAALHIAGKTRTHEHDTINRAKDYINKNFNREISLDDLSKQLDLSPYYFSKLFKEEVGSTFMEYLTGLRIERAKELLTESDMSMKEICSQVGYSDPNYFSRIFKKNMDMTPTEYRDRKN